MLETELVDRLKKGDESAYRLFVDTYQSTVLNCCFRLVGDRLAAEDLSPERFSGDKARRREARTPIEGRRATGKDPHLPPWRRSCPVTCRDSP